MKPIDFTEPVRQSSKGILVIFALNTFKFIRQFFVLFLILGLSIAKDKSSTFLSITQLILIPIGVFFVIFVFAILKYQNFKFHLDKEHFYLSSGIINKDMTIIPKSKIQNVYIKQNLIQQFINVVSLTIETAGDNKTEIEIHALNRSIALELKQQLFIRAQPAEIEKDGDFSESTVFFRVSMKRLLLEGISQNHMKSFVIIVSFVFGLYNEFEYYLQDLGIADRLGTSTFIESGGFVNLLLANFFLVVVAILGSILFSVVAVVIRNFNLEVIENDETIEINKGLFNKFSLILMPEKIQNIIIRTNRLKVFFGLHTLSIKQAMTSNKLKQNLTIVALENHQVSHLVQKFYNQYEIADSVHRPDAYFKNVLIFRAIFVGILVNVSVGFVFGYYFLLFNLILVPWLILFVHFTYQKMNYQITDTYLTVNSGFIDRVRNISELQKIQSVQIKQNIFQKQKNIASLHIATASDKVKILCIKEDKAKKIMDYLLFKLASGDCD